MGESASSLEGSALSGLFLDQDDIFEQICSRVELLLQNPAKLWSSNSYETFNNIESLMQEVIKLSKTGLVPSLGPSLFDLYQLLNLLVNCSALLEAGWLSIEDDQRTKDYLKALTYLKLSALCAFDDARLVWARLVEKVKYEHLPYKALEDLDLIKLFLEARDVDHVSAYHEFVGQGMRLICEAYSERSPRYKLYMALQEADVPWGQTCGRGCDGNVNTDEMVVFISDQLEGKYR
jgi:hypothetical protein